MIKYNALSHSPDYVLGLAWMMAFLLQFSMGRDSASPATAKLITTGLVELAALLLGIALSLRGAGRYARHGRRAAHLTCLWLTFVVVALSLGHVDALRTWMVLSGSGSASDFIAFAQSLVAPIGLPLLIACFQLSWWFRLSGSKRTFTSAFVVGLGSTIAVCFCLLHGTSHPLNRVDPQLAEVSRTALCLVLPAGIAGLAALSAAARERRIGRSRA